MIATIHFNVKDESISQNEQTSFLELTEDDASKVISEYMTITQGINISPANIDILVDNDPAGFESFYIQQKLYDGEVSINDSIVGVPISVVYFPHLYVYGLVYDHQRVFYVHGQHTGAVNEFNRLKDLYSGDVTEAKYEELREWITNRHRELQINFTMDEIRDQ